jgi:hypothetical protein
VLNEDSVELLEDPIWDPAIGLFANALGIEKAQQSNWDVRRP